jgi:hypothetical protein
MQEIESFGMCGTPGRSAGEPRVVETPKAQPRRDWAGPTCVKMLELVGV